MEQRNNFPLIVLDKQVEELPHCYTSEHLLPFPEISLLTINIST